MFKSEIRNSRAQPRRARAAAHSVRTCGAITRGRSRQHAVGARLAERVSAARSRRSASTRHLQRLEFIACRLGARCGALRCVRGSARLQKQPWLAAAERLPAAGERGGRAVPRPAAGATGTAGGCSSWRSCSCDGGRSCLRAAIFGCGSLQRLEDLRRWPSWWPNPWSDASRPADIAHEPTQM